jgi:uncharacterized protein YgiM (DUF1202 family)
LQGGKINHITVSKRVGAMLLCLRGALAIVLICAVVVTAAAEQSRLVIAKQGLKLRAGPGTQHEATMTLKFGTLVIVIEESGEWSKVSALDPTNRTKLIQGWVASRFLSSSKSLSRRPSTTGSDDLQVSVSSFNCREGFLDDAGYEECTVGVDLSLSGPHWVEMEVGINCTAEVETHTLDEIIPSRESGDAWETMYVTSGFGSTHMEIDVDFGFTIDPVVRAKLKDVNCWMD